MVSAFILFAALTRQEGVSNLFTPRPPPPDCLPKPSIRQDRDHRHFIVPKNHRLSRAYGSGTAHSSMGQLILILWGEEPEARVPVSPDAHSFHPSENWNLSFLWQALQVTTGTLGAKRALPSLLSMVLHSLQHSQGQVEIR